MLAVALMRLRTCFLLREIETDDPVFQSRRAAAERVFVNLVVQAKVQQRVLLRASWEIAGCNQR
jgi:hypothetical protein